jgi:hypothetical protein
LGWECLLCAIVSWEYLIFFLIFFFGGTVVRNQGFTLARQVLYHLAMPLALYSLVSFEIRSHFLPRSTWTRIFLFYVSHSSWYDRQVPQCPVLFCFFHQDRVSQTFLPGLD